MIPGVSIEGNLVEVYVWNPLSGAVEDKCGHHFSGRFSCFSFLINVWQMHNLLLTYFYIFA